ncbi:autotransporter domain-containing esterase [Xanthomonas maliensis]|uniref:autotransporter domain-containing esterase n=1 Tax=Xanthomonas maliensis TaxID=1321368 RepID=UPI00039FCD34|nr:autotransporter domain-containing esterase [Xanthomonas maliensis]KAB7764722.1 autotransporter domain-containing esterase [Xanthomonas maliensis]
MAVAIAIAAVPAMAESTFDRTVFFGDSLTDSGYYNPLLPAASRAVTGKFTTNPGWVWAEYVADHFGTNAAPNGNGQVGDNYAAGGARIQASSVSQLGAAPSVAAQVNSYLSANGGRADPNALYTVWGGANDLLAAATVPAQAQAIIGSAVTAQVGTVAALQSAGARYVMVPTIPDVGLTPRFRAGGATGMAQGTAAATAYNTALFGGLRSAGLKVIPVDTFHMLQEIVATPGTYGFSNVASTACNPAVPLPACNPTSLVAANAQNSYVFADSIHPTTAVHQILGEYAISLLEAPRLQQVLTRSAQAGGRSRADQVAWHLDGKPDADGARWWGSVRGDMQRYDHADLYDGTAPAGLFGVDWAAGDLVFGGFAGFGRMDADFGNRNGSFKERDTTLGGFFGWYTGPVWVNAQVSYSWLGYDVDRKVQLGPATRTHSGSPDGSNLTAALNAGYSLGEGSFKYGPVVGLTWQKIKLDGYTERSEANELSTALGYANQDLDSLVGRIGFQMHLDGAAVKPYLQATYDHEFKDGTEASAWLQSMPDVGMYTVPGQNFDRNYATVVLGARTGLWGLQSNFGLSTTTAQRSARDATLFVNFSGAF